ncbi:hypothetical protein SAY86_006659 [Trapa natans]|uniref:Uncharacterized protein n=1 Tax=Trapa natans TaxID=22666 RepID=A0AAN7QWC7_TRANT|nr:hypothetical protein SAY86_006659 [Trapa natans]
MSFSPTASHPTLLPALFDLFLPCLAELGTESRIIILILLGILLKSDLIWVLVKKIHDKIIEFEEIDLLVEKERQQLDQLMLSFYKNTGSKSEECVEENTRSG